MTTTVETTTEAPNLQKIAEALNAKPYVYEAKIWNEKRVYVNFVGADKGFAGDRNLKAYYDPKLGWVHEGLKGTMSRACRASFESFYADYAPTRR